MILPSCEDAFFSQSQSFSTGQLLPRYEKLLSGNPAMISLINTPPVLRSESELGGPNGFWKARLRIEGSAPRSPKCHGRFAYLLLLFFRNTKSTVGNGTAMVDGRWMDDHRCLRLYALCPHNAEPSVTLRANAAAAGPLMMFHSVPAVGGLTQHVILSVLAPSYDADGKSLAES